MIFITEEERGQTGQVSPGKIIAWFWIVVAIYLNLVYFELFAFMDIADCADVKLTFWRWILANFMFGMLSVGFYWGLAKDGFPKMMDALINRIKGA